jgi:hypothetical protein
LNIEDDDEHGGGNEITAKYGNLKMLSDSINKSMSPILFCYVFEAIFYYSTSLHVIFTTKDWHAR